MKRKVLIVWGGWDGHTPEKSANLFVPWLREQGFDVEVSTTLDSYKDEKKMNNLSLIVQCWTMGEIDKEQKEGLSKAVSNGVGMVGWHGGIIDSFRKETEYQFMTGGQWVAHPGGCIPSYDIKIVDRKHELTRGIKDFTIKDSEQYYIHYDPAVHVLCTTTFSGKHGKPEQYVAGTVMPYAYTRSWGKGRVFVACWGHTFKDFEVPEAFEIVKRSMLWAVRK